MSIWRQLTHGLRVLTNRKTADQEISDEVENYLEQAVAELVKNGVPLNEARRRARLELGSLTAVREEVRLYGWENTLGTLFASLRHAVRRLLHAPGFTAVSLLMLALGIGASTAIFSVIEGVLLKPLPYPQPEQLVSLRHTAPGLNIENLPMGPSLYFTYLDENRVFQDIGLWSTSTSSVTGQGKPEEVPVLMLTARLLPILGVRPAIGRGFTISDNDPKSTPTVMLADGYWRSHFGSDRSVLGHRLVIDGNAVEVIGVLPQSFEFMDEKISLLMPLQFNRAELFLGQFKYQGIARLKPGVTIKQANADIERMIPLVPTKFPPPPFYSAKAFDEARLGPKLLLLKDKLVGDSGNTLWVLMGTVGAVLLIACANVANLLLVRADGRQQELAIRAALGAGWTRMSGELLLESLLLALGGGALGLALAYGALRMLKVSELANLPRIDNISIDPSVLAVALSISVASGLLFGLIPLFKYARPHFRTHCAAADARSAKVEIVIGRGHSRRCAGGACAGSAGQLRSDDPNIPSSALCRSWIFRRQRSTDNAHLDSGVAGQRTRARDSCRRGNYQKN